MNKEIHTLMSGSGNPYGTAGGVEKNRKKGQRRVIMLESSAPSKDLNSVKDLMTKWVADLAFV